jgi:uncharacterized membrane protein
MKKRLGLLWYTTIWFVFICIVSVVPNYEELVEDHTIWIVVGVALLLAYAIVRTLKQPTE